MDTGYFLSEEKAAELELVFGTWKHLGGIGGYLRNSSIEGAVMFLVALAALLHINAEPIFITAIPFAAFFAPFLLNYIIAYYIFDSRRKAMESHIPDMLLHAASFPKGTSVVSTIKNIGNSDYEILSQEFRKAHSEILRGATPEKAFSNMKTRNRSRVLERAVDLILEGMNSGTDAGAVFKDAAEDILETNSVMQERASSLVVQKYTLLIAGALIVPLVLGLVVKTVNGLDFATLSGLELGMPPAQRKALLEAASFAGQVYIAEYVVIASVFVAFFESDIKKATVYAIVLLPLSILCYNAIQMV